MDGVGFVCRSYTHDDMKYKNYFTVGVNMGVISRKDGTVLPTDRDCWNDIKVLAKHKEWLCAIQASDENGPDFFEKNEFPSIHSNGCFIAPQTFITQDDCDCCSLYG